MMLQTIENNLHFRLGLFVLGCCPGGTGSNFWTLLLNGDINMSITMTFMSTVLALGFMPLWIFTMGIFLIINFSNNCIYNFRIYINWF